VVAREGFEPLTVRYAFYVLACGVEAAETCGRTLVAAAAFSRVRPHVAFVAVGVTGESEP
jgi:hypothetical protein